MKRCIHTSRDLNHWKSSEAHHRLLSTLRTINEAIADMPISASPHTRLGTRVCALFKALEGMIDENPPRPMGNNQRYGNPAFRQYFAAVTARLPDLCAAQFGELFAAEVRSELAAYVQGSLGNHVRIDYGTGHELSYLAFLAALSQVASPAREDYQAMGLDVTAQYLRLVRRLQLEYSLEPAGSHGVWGLDDYQFVPFLWGSAQLRHNVAISPDAITNRTLLERHAGEFHYLDAIAFVLQIKRGGCFWEHSPVLYDISGIPSWDRVNRGLWRMYQEEVLGKFPVIQHFEFGSLLPWDRAAT